MRSMPAMLASNAVARCASERPRPPSRNSSSRAWPWPAQPARRNSWPGCRDRAPARRAARPASRTGAKSLIGSLGQADAEARRHRLRARGGDPERIAVRCGLGGRVDADIAAGARAVLDHDLLAEAGAELLGDDARNDVGAAAGGEGGRSGGSAGPAMRRRWPATRHLPPPIPMPTRSLTVAPSRDLSVTVATSSVCSLSP